MELSSGEYTPSIVLVFSGKRKSGKDFITDLLLERIGADRVALIKLSAPIKKHWALSCGLDISKLLDSSPYKEKYRQDMILWGESVREKDYGYFCRQALELSRAHEKPIWIISDARRKTDIKWFLENFKNVKTIRIRADDGIRKQRGWVFSEGVDTSASECDLDDFKLWDIEITNNNSECLEKVINSILEITQGK